jgi:hypothetical protein
LHFPSLIAAPGGCREIDHQRLERADPTASLSTRLYRAPFLGVYLWVSRHKGRASQVAYAWPVIKPPTRAERSRYNRAGQVRLPPGVPPTEHIRPAGENGVEHTRNIISLTFTVICGMLAKCA